MGVFKRDRFLPDPHLTGRRSIHVFSKKKRKEKTSFNISKTVTFRMKPVVGSSITICASSVYEYPSFFVRSITGRTILLIANVKSNTPKGWLPTHYHTAGCNKGVDF
jgi:hypothetical protein